MSPTEILIAAGLPAGRNAAMVYAERLKIAEHYGLATEDDADKIRVVAAIRRAVRRLPSRARQPRRSRAHRRRNAHRVAGGKPLQRAHAQRRSQGVRPVRARDADHAPAPHREREALRQREHRQAATARTRRSAGRPSCSIGSTERRPGRRAGRFSTGRFQRYSEKEVVDHDTAALYDQKRQNREHAYGAYRKEIERIDYLEDHAVRARLRHDIRAKCAKPPPAQA